MNSTLDNDLKYNDLDDRSCLQFNFLSAGLTNFLPSIRGKEHFSIYRKLLINLNKAYTDIETKEFIQKAILIDNSKESLKDLATNGPLIICAFHTGSYRLLNLFLAKWQVQVSLLLNQIALKDQGELFHKIYSDNSGRNDLLELIDSDSPRSGFGLLKAISQKRVIVAYIDGNAGLGNRATENKNSTLINFLEGQLYVRGGLGYLSYKTKTPILPIAAHFDKDYNNVVECFPLIKPSATLNKDEYVQQAMQEIYNHAGKLIKNNPDQWEGWFYIHKSALIQDFNEDETLSEENLTWFVPEKYGAFKMGEDYYLMSKKDYSFQKINSVLYKKLIQIPVFI